MNKSAQPETFPKIKPAGDSHLLVELGDTINPQVAARVKGLAVALQQAAPEWLIELLPSYAALLISYDIFAADYRRVEEEVRRLAAKAKAAGDQGKLLRLPVLYGGAAGPDLTTVAAHNNLNEQQVIDIHSGRDYPVYMLGFSPGFPYLGGMDETIACPRLDTPRLKVPARSVGIAGKQTGIYSQESPGGWQLIGRTPIPLFAPESQQPFPISAGDLLRFVPITEQQYQQVEKGETEWQL